MLRQTPEMMARLIDLLVDAVCVVDRDGHFSFISAAGEELFGRAADSMLGHSMLEFLHPEDREATLAAAAKVMHGEALRHFQNRYLRPDGSVVDLMWSARWFEAEGLRIAVARDITELKQAERRQATLYALSQAAHAACDLLQLLRDTRGLLQPLLPDAQLQLALLVQDSPLLQLYPATPADAPPELRDAQGEPRYAELLNGAGPLHLPATASTPEWLGLLLQGPRGPLGALVLEAAPGRGAFAAAEIELLEFVGDQLGHVIERLQANAQLRHQASHDDLTGLPNRSSSLQAIALALRLAQTHGHRLAVLYLDLDHFKEINDQHGHPVGDALLVAFAQRLRQSVRAADFIGRMGGDEFLVLLTPLQLHEQAQLIAEQLLQRLCEPIEFSALQLDVQMQVQASIGLAVFPEDGSEVEHLVMQADTAMYRAKSEGGARLMSLRSRSAEGSEPEIAQSAAALD